MAAPPAHSRQFIWKLVSVALGIATGLVLLEMLVRPFSSVQLPPAPDIAHDVLAGLLIESRQIEEGVQASRFTSGGSRWTGTAPAPEAPAIVIIGDSYVVAREVADDETMGAWVERFSRDAGVPVNVRQYGWRAARPAQYVNVAPDVIERWSPAKVVVVLADNDFDSRALTDTIIQPPAQSGLLARSSLMMLARHRKAWLEPRLAQATNRWKVRLGVVTASAPVEAPEVDLPPPAGDAPSAPPSAAAETPTGIEAAVVQALARAYGSRLSIIYVANTRMRGGEEPDANERRLAAACAVQRVEFASTRAPMLELRRQGVVVRGFSTTTLGSGHLNVGGHEMMGRLIWSMVRDDVERATR